MTLGEVKGQISSKFSYKVNFKFFLHQTLCVFSQIKDIKHIEWNFYSGTLVMSQGWDLGCWGSKTLAWGFEMMPYRLHDLVLLLLLFWFFTNK